MIKYYCDICNTEVTYRKSYKLQSFGQFDELDDALDICYACREKIEEFISEIKYNKRNL